MEWADARSLAVTGCLFSPLVLGKVPAHDFEDSVVSATFEAADAVAGLAGFAVDFGALDLDVSVSGFVLGHPLGGGPIEGALTGSGLGVFNPVEGVFCAGVVGEKGAAEVDFVDDLPHARDVGKELVEPVSVPTAQDGSGRLVYGLGVF